MTVLGPLDGHLVIGAMLVLSNLVMLLNVVVLQALECDADLTAAELTRDPAGLASALTKRRRMNQANAVTVLASHPPMERRVSHLNAIAAAWADEDGAR